MKTQKFIYLKLDEIINKILNDLPNKFDSHQFIEPYSILFKNQYEYSLSTYTGDAYKKVHAQIGMGLVKNMEYLKIMKNGKVKSENVRGNISRNEQWIKK